jgi:hypothetical protein
VGLFDETICQAAWREYHRNKKNGLK